MNSSGYKIFQSGILCIFIYFVATRVCSAVRHKSMILHLEVESQWIISIHPLSIPLILYRVADHMDIDTEKIHYSEKTRHVTHWEVIMRLSKFERNLMSWLGGNEKC